MSAIGTLEKVEIAEVLNEMVRRACNFEKPKNTMPTTTSTTSTTSTIAYRSKKNQAKATDEAFIEQKVDQVLVEPILSEAAYPNLVSIIN